MRKFEKDPRFYELETIEEARQFRTDKGFLSRFFADKITTIVGAVHSSPYLQKLAASCAHLNPDHLPVGEEECIFSKGKVRFKGDHPDVDHLSKVATGLGNYLEPLFGRTMLMGIYNRRASDIQEVHIHPSRTTASLPLGQIHWLSTLWENEAGQLIGGGPNFLTVVDETIRHRSEISNRPQLVLTASILYKTLQ